MCISVQITSAKINFTPNVGHIVNLKTFPANVYEMEDKTTLGLSRYLNTFLASNTLVCDNVVIEVNTSPSYPHATWN